MSKLVRDAEELAHSILESGGKAKFTQARLELVATKLLKQRYSTKYNQARELFFGEKPVVPRLARAYADSLVKPEVLSKVYKYLLAKRSDAFLTTGKDGPGIREKSAPVLKQEPTDSDEDPSSSSHAHSKLVMSAIEEEWIVWPIWTPAMVAYASLCGIIKQSGR